MSTLKDSYDHVIVGGGVAADKAARAIRERQPEATIAILSADTDGPVYRPALTKDLWLKDDPDPASQDLHTADETESDLFTDCEVTSIDPDAHRVTTTAGTPSATGACYWPPGPGRAASPASRTNVWSTCAPSQTTATCAR